MEVPEESFHWSSWDSRTCYPRRAFIQGLTDDIMAHQRKDNMFESQKAQETRNLLRVLFGFIFYSFYLITAFPLQKPILK